MKTYDKFAEEFANIYMLGVKMSKLDIEITKTQIENLKQIRKNHFYFKPFKLFRKKYSTWENELDYYDEQISNLYRDLSMFYDDYYNLIKPSK